MLCWGHPIYALQGVGVWVLRETTEAVLVSPCLTKAPHLSAVRRLMFPGRCLRSGAMLRAPRQCIVWALTVVTMPQVRAEHGIARWFQK